MRPSLTGKDRAQHARSQPRCKDIESRKTGRVRGNAISKTNRLRSPACHIECVDASGATLKFVSRLLGSEIEGRS